MISAGSCLDGSLKKGRRKGWQHEQQEAPRPVEVGLWGQEPDPRTQRSSTFPALWVDPLTCTKNTKATCPAEGTQPVLQPQFTPKRFVGGWNIKISVSQIHKGLSVKERGTGAKREEGDANRGNALLPPGLSRRWRPWITPCGPQAGTEAGDALGQRRVV